MHGGRQFAVCAVLVVASGVCALAQPPAGPPPPLPPRLSLAAPKTDFDTLREKDATLPELLTLLGEATQKTILHGQQMPKLSVHLSSVEPKSREQWAVEIEAAVTNAGLRVVREGEKFLLVLAANQQRPDVASAQAFITDVTGPGPDGDKGQLGRQFLYFQNVDLRMALDFFAELTGRTVLKPQALHSAQVSLKSGSALTREEAVHAFNMVMALNGVRILPLGEKFVVVAPEMQPVDDALKAVLRTPERSPDEVVVGPTGTRFRSASLEQISELYANVTGCTVQLLPSTPACQFDFLPVKNLTRRETAQALEVLFALNNLRIVPATGNAVTVMHAAEARKLTSP
jgi:hypothetical protein